MGGYHPDSRVDRQTGKQKDWSTEKSLPYRQTDRQTVNRQKKGCLPDSMSTDRQTERLTGNRQTD